MQKIMKADVFRLFLAPKAVRAEVYAAGGRSEILSLNALRQATREITSWPGYAVTPLRQLRGLARAAGIRSIFYKDEGGRFGLGSFKALGGAYAVATTLKDAVTARTGVTPTTADLTSGRFRELTSGVTVTCATDGNHGRSVAWGAKMFGCRCVIYVHANVSQGRRDAIAAYGAEVHVVDGTYDASVQRAAEEAARSGWMVVSDTSYEGYVDIPRRVMQGYGVMVEEAFAQLPPGVRATHVFIQGGVGGLAASVCSYVWETLEADAPAMYVVEPNKAPCLLLSAEAGQPTKAEGDLDTIMAGLACGEVSLLAWSILEKGIDGYLAISDEAAKETMRLLATSPYGDGPVVAGESAVPGLTGLLLVAQDFDAKQKLALKPESVVLVIGTEGATDPELYSCIVGLNAEVIAGE